MQALLLSCSFFTTILLAVTFVPSLPYPFAYTPLVMITGLLTMHRVGVGPGVVWLVLGAITMQLQHTGNGWSAAIIVSSAVAVLLVERVFATRSVYALLGIGFVTGIVATIVHIVLGITSSLVGGTAFSFKALVLQNTWTLLLLLIGLYGGFVVIGTLRAWTRHLFVVR